MPELPEVETIRQGLDRWVTGRVIASVEVLHPRAVRRHVAGPADFADALAGRTVTGIRRRGKYLWLPLDDGAAVVGHLGMSGQMLLRPGDAPDETHLRIRFRFTDGGPHLRFVVPSYRRRSRTSRWTRSIRPLWTMPSWLRCATSEPA